MATDYISAGLVCTCQVLILEFRQFNCLISFFSTCQELNVLSLFYVHRWPLLRDGSLFFLNQCSVFLFSPLQGILFHPAKETYRRAWHHKQGWLAPHSQAILTILIVLMWKYHFLLSPKMENALLSTGLPSAPDYVSHLDKIIHDGHCKYGNSSLAMKIWIEIWFLIRLVSAE